MKTTIQIVREFLALPDLALPTASYVDPNPGEDFWCSTPWRDLRDFVKGKVEYPCKVLLRADRPEWKDGVEVYLGHKQPKDKPVKTRLAFRAADKYADPKWVPIPLDATGRDGEIYADLDADGDLVRTLIGINYGGATGILMCRRVHKLLPDNRIRVEASDYDSHIVPNIKPKKST